MRGKDMFASGVVITTLALMLLLSASRASAGWLDMPSASESRNSLRRSFFLKASRKRILVGFGVEW